MVVKEQKKMNIYKQGVSTSLDAMARGEFSSVELVKSCLSRIDDTDEYLGAFITVDREKAIDQARRADKKRAEKRGGFLCGIPVSIKDLICTKGLQTTCGSKMLKNYIPPYDATVIKRIKQEDAVIIGKVSMDEFAMGSTSETCAFTIPQNPYKKGYIAGGSSGGSAVSVAACQCPASLGSDTGGSIRQPASFCGVVGIKPTYGRVSRYGLTAFASSLDQIGPFTRNVEDCAKILQVISGYDEMDSTSVNCSVPDFSTFLRKGLKGMRVGVAREFFTEALDPEVNKTVQNALKILQQSGAKIVDLSLPHTEYCVAVYYIVASSEASSNLARYDGVVYGYRTDDKTSLIDMYKKTRSKGFGDEVKRRILIGTYALSSGYYDAYYKKASQVRTLILEDFKRAFEQCDVLVSPVTPTPAWKRGQNRENPLAMYLSDILTLSTNLAGIPGISVPGGFSREGLPIGVQLQGPHFSEGNLLRFAWNLQEELQLQHPCFDVKTICKKDLS